MDKTIRILDANLNRGREGLRVVEDLVRFALDDADLASQIKAMRHEVASLVRQLPLDESELLSARDSEGDVGADLDCASEDLRIGLSQIATANIRRSQEAMRVLEELSKLWAADDEKSGPGRTESRETSGLSVRNTEKSTSVASQFKKLRFQLYQLEKEILPKLVEYQTQSGYSDTGCCA